MTPEQNDLDAAADLPVTFKNLSTVLDGIRENLYGEGFVDLVALRLAKRKEAADGRAELELVTIISGLERRIAQLEMEKAGRASR